MATEAMEATRTVLSTLTTLGMLTGQVVLASDDPRGVVAVLRLSHASYRKMVQNLAWARWQQTHLGSRRRPSPWLPLLVAYPQG
jgi:hypothetical protein